MFTPNSAVVDISKQKDFVLQQGGLRKIDYPSVPANVGNSGVPDFSLFIWYSGKALGHLQTHPYFPLHIGIQSIHMNTTVVVDGLREGIHNVCVPVQYKDKTCHKGIRKQKKWLDLCEQVLKFTSLRGKHHKSNL